jgi:hypothetical protein
MRPRVVAAWVVALACAVLLMGCGGRGASSTPPASGAARVIPADALAYVSVSLDAGRSAVRQASATVIPLPGYRELLTGLRSRLSAITGVPFGTGIRPWLGTEAAVALVPEADSASELIVLGVKRPALASRFVATVTTAAARLVDGYVVVGEPAIVAAAGRGASLAANVGFRRAESVAAPDRVLDAYATGRGLSELLGGHTGVEGVLAQVASAEAPATVAAALSPTGDGLRLSVRLTRSRPAAVVRFRPALAAALPASTAGLVQMPSLTASGPEILAALAAASGSDATAGLLGRLGPALRDQGVALGPLERLFSGPSAIFVLDGTLGLITDTADARAARLELGSAGQALAELFAPRVSAGVEPVVSTRSVKDTQVTDYQQGAASQLAYAVFGGHVVLDTSAGALTAIIDQTRSLASTPLYRSVLAGSGPSAGPVLFGAINRLVRPGGLSGLLQQLDLQRAIPTLGRISAAGLTSTGGTSETTAEMFFTIS